MPVPEDRARLNLPGLPTFKQTILSLSLGRLPLKAPERMGFVSIASVLAISALAAVAQAAAAQQVPVTAFVAVNVLPMDSDRVLAKQTVLIQDGRITAVGPHLAVPRGARIID